ncbi:MAG: hypothetical protein IMF11_19305, partial [Proteobacteria bacterium]|nr:hypothetical protein [Pseudomonadota bacterium]
MKRTASFYGICYIVPVLVFASIWFPVIVHYYVPGAVITDELLNKARELPDHQVFEELNGFRFLDIKFKDDKELVLVAEKLLEGELKLPWRPATRIGMPFDAEDIDKGLPSWKLYIASFAVPDILLRAYKVTARDDFIMMARDVIVAWALYEGSAWLPKGLLWNDHAIAARIPVLAEFWSLYRNHP